MWLCINKLNAQQGKIIGPSKVMAVKRSELLDVSTQYWYNEELGETVIDDLSEIMAGVLLNLTGAGIGVIPSGPEQGLALINNVSGSQYQALETSLTNSRNHHKAFILHSANSATRQKTTLPQHTLLHPKHHTYIVQKYSEG